MPAATLRRPDPHAGCASVEAAIAAAIAALSSGNATGAASILASVDPRDATAAHRNLVGRVLLAADAPGPALGWFDLALLAEPRFLEALLNRAGVLLLLGRTRDAIVAYEAAEAAGARDPVAFYNHGALLRDEGQLERALAAFQHALRLRPAYPDALHAAGLVHKALGRPAEALRDFDAALQLAPQALDLWLDRANLLHGLERTAEALATLDLAVTCQPGSALLHNNRGIMRHDLGRMDDALADYDAALTLDPRLVQAHHNRGNVLVRLCRHGEAVRAFDTAFMLNPGHAEAWASRGLALKLLGRFADAMESFETALLHDPTSIHARANRGELKLLLGDFTTGWADYEFRFFTERQTKPRLKTMVPEWDGRPRAGARIVVLADQGNGDVIQFARFLPQLAATGAHVTFVCPARLHRLLRPLTSAVAVRADVGDEAAYDFQIALSSMPGAFRTDLATLAESRPYLAAESARVGPWRERLSGGLTIGLCWRGSQNWQCDPNRSIPLAALAPLATLPNARLISLQLPDNAEPGGAALPIEDIGGELDRGEDAFVDTAAVVANVDLVVTCDTSIAHLAGALGRPTFVLLQAVPEWRWMLGRDTSPWYPTMRLFRQPGADDWQTPVAAAVAAIRRGEHRLGPVG